MSHIIDCISKADNYREEQGDFYWSPEVFVSDFNPIQVEVPWFSNVWVHSEHENETGTHKDRKALTLAYYMKMLAGHPEVKNHIPIPQQVYSIISSWSAAKAISNAINKLNGVPLRALLWENTSPEIIKSLEGFWCEVHKILLTDKELSQEDILKATDNENGIELTSAYDTMFLNSYLQLTYDMVYWKNSDFDHIITPYGTGELYNNLTLMGVWDIEKMADYIERLAGIPYWIPYTTWKPVSVWWATTKNLNSRMDKLTAPSLPFLPAFQSWENLLWWPYTLENTLPRSNKLKNAQIVNISDDYLDKAAGIFDNHSIPAEPSALSSLAMLLENPDRFKPDEKILLVSTWKCKI